MQTFEHEQIMAVHVPISHYDVTSEIDVIFQQRFYGVGEHRLDDEVHSPDRLFDLQLIGT